MTVTETPTRYPAGRKPPLSGKHSRGELITIRVFLPAPFLASSRPSSWRGAED
jgi:hypothetical protein